MRSWNNLTLLLNLIGPFAIHSCSDYRLTDLRTHRPIEDEAGSKQLGVTREGWSAEIAFTGVAQVGPRKTRDWILQTFAALADEGINSALARLKQKGTQELAVAPLQFRHLTITVAVTEGRKALRFFLISNFDRPDGPPLSNPLDQLVLFDLSSPKYRGYIFGLKSCVTPADVKLLKQLSRIDRDAAEVRSALSQINRRASMRSGGLVSAECMVSTLFVEGHASSQNFGGQGIPSHLMGPNDVADVIRGNLRPLPGHHLTVVQRHHRFANGKSNASSFSMNVSKGDYVVVTFNKSPGQLLLTDSMGTTGTKIGDFDSLDVDDTGELSADDPEARIIEIRSPSGVGSIPGLPPNFVRVAITGIESRVIAKKNLRIGTVLNKVSIQLDSTAATSIGPTFRAAVQFPVLPTIDGVQPQTWNYVLDIDLDGQGRWTFSIRQNLVAFRLANLDKPMTVLNGEEELVMVAPRKPVILRLTSTTRLASADIEALFQIRDPDRATPASEQIERRQSKVGRNELCPCGSKKKYKKCCGAGLTA